MENTNSRKLNNSTILSISGVKLPLDYKAGSGGDGRDSDLFKKAFYELRPFKINPSDIKSVSLLKRSVDARKKQDIHFQATLKVALNIPLKPDTLLKLEKSKHVSVFEKPKYEAPHVNSPIKPSTANPPIVVGAGPAGLFAALTLAKAGFEPILIERGKPALDRIADIENLNKNGVLNPESNIQFGEGGAGTFSDGKLTTGIKNPRCGYVLECMVEAGANEEILWQAKPHIGTDVLVGMVTQLRNSIIKLGGRVLFEHKLTGLEFESGNLCGITVVHGTDEIHLETNNLILAIGHSARDTAKMLYEKRVEIAAKPFAVGVRIEHLKADIDKAQYGEFAGHKRLGASDYKLVNNPPKESGLRSVYTFCMCPGGDVVNASSEAGRLAVNGMSRWARDSVNSNSALLVGVNPEDYYRFASEHTPKVLAGFEFQRRLEEQAYALGGAGGINAAFKAPVQLVGDFLKNQESKSFGKVSPSFPNGTSFAKLDRLFPDYITHSLKAALPQFGRRIAGFDSPDAVLTGVESRSSSPIRIVRSENGESLSAGGVYPCGEGAGYAGGIMSAAVDGMMSAERVIEKIKGK